MTTRAREVATLLDWLRGEARDWKTKLPHEPPEQFDAWTDALSALIAECETAKAELAEAVKVMEPFAVSGDAYSTFCDCSGCEGSRAAARAFIARHPQPVPVGEEKGETK